MPLWEVVTVILIVKMTKLMHNRSKNLAHDDPAKPGVGRNLTFVGLKTCARSNYYISYFLIINSAFPEVS